MTRSRPWSDQIAAELRRLAVEGGVRQVEIAETTGMSQSQVSRLLSGVQRMCIDDLVDLSHAVGARPTDVMHQARRRLGRMGRQI